MWSPKESKPPNSLPLSASAIVTKDRAISSASQNRRMSFLNLCCEKIDQIEWRPRTADASQLVSIPKGE